jgi:hypothetical protein
MMIRSAMKAEDWDRRHGTPDRRVSHVAQRLRKGLWLQYHRQTEAGKFDELWLSHKTRDLLFAAFVNEACRYRFSDRIAGEGVDPAEAVQTALEVLWSEWLQDRAKRSAIRVTEQTADYITAHFNVTKIDRRYGDRGPE